MIFQFQRKNVHSLDRLDVCYPCVVVDTLLGLLSDQIEDATTTQMCLLVVSADARLHNKASLVVS